MAPLFLNKNQRFIEQHDLKRGMVEFTEYYESLPDEIKQKGSATYAEFPPRQGDFFVSRLYDNLFDELNINWREYAEREPEPRDPEEGKKILKRAREIMDQIKDDK